MISDSQALLKLLQLASPALPVGGYSYSEGLETLVQRGLTSPGAITQWLEQELAQGQIRADGVGLYRVYGAAQAGCWAEVVECNQWLSALRDSEEARQQSWAMGRALTRLILDLQPELAEPMAVIGQPCNFAVGFGLVAAHWQIPAPAAGLAYVHNWAANLITAAVKLVPLGQTQGQQMLLALYPALAAAAENWATLPWEAVTFSNWGTALACMQHETLYSRLFRS
ncbi:MAG TPA: urease accessory protein UreF [Leptolyngbyaceae cyanobacterium M65_K2018_010]|nr:urease accessory protein UreF [Leptolyngbyaceae cyanobacterium M65_K2018_010]